MDAIVTKSLTKKYKDLVAVDNLDLSIAEGELFALLGVNGAGKTTTVKMLSCLSAPTSGDAWLCGRSICSEAPAVKELIALSPQESAVAANLTVKENLALICGCYGFDKTQTAKATEEMIKTFDLEQVLHKRVGKLSGGWQRRLSIAMALISRPKILFLDEPTLGLDVLARADLWDTIRNLKGKITIILTTHYMEEAEALSDRIGIMRDGRLLTCGTAQQLKEQAGTDNFEDAFVRIVRGAAK